MATGGQACCQHNTLWLLLSPPLHFCSIPACCLSASYHLSSLYRDLTGGQGPPAEFVVPIWESVEIDDREREREREREMQEAVVKGGGQADACTGIFFFCRDKSLTSCRTSPSCGPVSQLSVALPQSSVPSRPFHGSCHRAQREVLEAPGCCKAGARQRQPACGSMRWLCVWSLQEAALLCPDGPYACDWLHASHGHPYAAAVEGRLRVGSHEPGHPRCSTLLLQPASASILPLLTPRRH